MAFEQTEPHAPRRLYYDSRAGLIDAMPRPHVTGLHYDDGRVEIVFVDGDVIVRDATSVSRLAGK